MDDLEIKLDTNIDEWTKGLLGIERVVLPRVFARMLNNAAATTHKALKAYTEQAIDRPNAFTKRAWQYTKANPADRDKMFTVIEAQPKQAQYLYFLVFGGEREPGDAGTNKKFDDMYSSAAKLSRYGGVDLKFIKRVMQRVKKEREERKIYRDRRKAIADRHLPRAGEEAEMDALKWVNVSKNKPGVFIGTIKGVKGVWERPQRLKARQRQRIIKKARKEKGQAWVEQFGGATKSASSTSIGWNKPGAQAKLLVALSRETKYNKTFDFFGVTERAMMSQMTDENFHSLLETEVESGRKLRASGLSDDAIISRVLNNSKGFSSK